MSQFEEGGTPPASTTASYAVREAWNGDTTSKQKCLMINNLLLVSFKLRQLLKKRRAVYRV